MLPIAMVVAGALSLVSSSRPTSPPMFLHGKSVAAGARLALPGISSRRVSSRALEAGMQAVQADAVVDSVGINVHLHFLDTPYSDFAKVKSSLQQLGVRHIRDSLVDTTWAGYYERHNELGTLGIKSIFITDVGQTSALLGNYPSRMSQCFEGFEDPNEYDARHVTHFADALKQHIMLLSRAAHGLEGQHYPVIGPSLVEPPSSALLGDVHEYIDYANLHNYPGGHHPGTEGWGGLDAQGNAAGGMRWARDLLAITSPGRPMVTTETGYSNDSTKREVYAPEGVAAVYLPRMILEQWHAGVTRTYVYELVSSLGEDFGLFRSDWTAKPAFHALANLISLLADPGNAFQPARLNYALQGGDAYLHQLLLEKRDGSFYLALWLEESSFDTGSGKQTSVSAEKVHLQLPVKGFKVTSYQWDSIGNVGVAELGAAASLTVLVSDRLMLLKVSR